MNTHADKASQDTTQAFANRAGSQQNSGQPHLHFLDHRPEANRLQNLQAMANDSLQTKRLDAFQDMAGSGQAGAENHIAQRQPQPADVKKSGPKYSDNTGIGHAPLQRKTMTQAGLDEELHVMNSRTRGKVIGSNAHNGIIYNNGDFEESASREDALKKSAAMAAQVGVGVQSWAAKDAKRTVKGRMYTTADFDNKDVETLDPFIHETKLTYHDKTADVGKSIGLFYQHTNDMDGYVSAIIETDDNGNNFAGAMKKGSATVSSAVPNYASNHAAQGGNLLAATEVESADRFDPITKLAGEGARFHCVYNHTSRLQDDSIFYTKEGDKYRGIQFKHLYVVWTTTFHGAFGISDLAVANAIRGKDKLLGTKRGGQKRPEYPMPLYRADQLDAKDYNLDTGNLVVEDEKGARGK